MTSKIHCPREDRTMHNRQPGEGSSATMLCWGCNKPKSRAGAKRDKRTGFMKCASCVAPKP